MDTANPRLSQPTAIMARGSLYSAVYWGVIGVFEPSFNVHLQNLGITGSQIGLLGAILPFLQLWVAPLYSGWADRLGKRRWMLAGALLVVAVVLFIFPWAHTFPAVLTLSLLLALGRSPTVGLGDGISARMAARHGLEYGRMRMWGSVGFGIIAIACGYIWSRTGTAAMFPTAAVVALLAALAVGFLEEEPPAQGPAQRFPLQEIRSNRVIVVLLISSFLIGGALWLGVIFGGVYMTDLGGGLEMVGITVGLPAFLEMPAMYLSGRLVRRWGGTKTLLLGYALVGAYFLGLALVKTPMLALLMALLRGPGFGLFMVSTVVLLERNAPPGWAATVVALMSAVSFGLAPLLSSPLGGWIYQHLGPQTMFAFAAGLVGAGALVLWWGREKPASSSGAAA